MTILLELQMNVCLAVELDEAICCGDHLEHDTYLGKKSEFTIVIYSLDLEIV